MSDHKYACRPISEGAGKGEALLSTDALCFAMCEADTGCVLEKGHCLDGRSGLVRAQAISPGAAPAG